MRVRSRRCRPAVVPAAGASHAPARSRCPVSLLIRERRRKASGRCPISPAQRKPHRAPTVGRTHAARGNDAQSASPHLL
eukprot:5480279-Prymnesium_polylepis.1